MELRHYLAILRRHWMLIVVCVAVGVAGGFATTDRTTVYEASASVYVGSRQLTTSADPQAANDALQTVERSITTFALMIDSRPIASAALDNTGVARSVDGVVGATTTFAVPNTQLILVVVRDRDPAVARDLANALSSAFVDKVREFEPSSSAPEGAVPSLPAYVFERANLPTAPAGNALNRNVLVGAMFGLVVAAGISFLVDYLDITVRSVGDAERRLELPVLGVIPIDQLRPEVPEPRVIRLARETA